MNYLENKYIQFRADEKTHIYVADLCGELGKCAS